MRFSAVCSLQALLYVATQWKKTSWCRRPWLSVIWISVVAFRGLNPSCTQCRCVCREVDGSVCKESNNWRDQKTRQQESGRNEVSEGCLCCMLVWETPCLPPVKFRQDRETCWLPNFPKIPPQYRRLSESRNQDQMNHSHKYLICYGHISSCSCAGTGVYSVLQECDVGCWAHRKIFAFFSFPPSPNNSFMPLF